ncbi:MAG: hypothetical protein J6T80_05650 [Paludibacteraceae bacterium]|nr:hypothetical protein [Paludibacteraceae bacterium]
MSKRLSLFVVLCSLLFASCNPEAPWTTKKVEISMKVETVSAGFVECSFATNKEAYYYIDITPMREGYDPMTQQKQFMSLALDSADIEYREWRSELLKKGEFNVAPFASHMLQYGPVDHFFTGLLPNTKYWIYAFAVNPETLKPAGRLNLISVTTTDESVVNVHFDYRVKGRWDYIYPVDSLGNINARFPYIASTIDSTLLHNKFPDISPQVFFMYWMLDLFISPEDADVLYGVKAVYNDGYNSWMDFEEGHTYYTAIGGFDGSFKQYTLYRFSWEGDSTELYFSEQQNIKDGQDW